MGYVHRIKCNIFQPLKGRNSDTKGQLLYDFSYMQYLEQAKSQRQKVEWRLPRAGEEGIEEPLFNGYRVSVLQDKNSSGDEWQ